MSRHYSDESRANDKWSLPDIETFYHKHGRRDEDCLEDEDGKCMGTGWYYWYCLPGCMPDSEPTGPFRTEQEALNVARED